VMDVAALLNERQAYRNVKQLAIKAASDKKVLDALLTIIFKNEGKAAEYAGWTLTHVTDKDPEVFKSYHKKMLKHLTRKDVYYGIHRNLIRVFCFATIDKKLEKELISICLYFINDENCPMAVQNFGLHILWRYQKINPELEGQILDICFRFLNQADADVGLLHHSIKIIWELSKKYPELLPELKDTVKIVISKHPAPSINSLVKKLKLL
jgi:hypothetical protein